jgi:hypothetical protein
MTLNPDNLSKPEAYAEQRFKKRYRVAIQKRGICCACVFRDRTFDVDHCKGFEDRRDGACKTDGKLPQFAVDATALEVFRDAA